MDRNQRPATARILCGWKALRTDEAGSIEAMSYVLITAIVGLGMIIGLATFRDGVTQSMGDVADALATVNQTYTVSMTFAQINGGTTSKNFGYTDSPTSYSQTAGNPPADMNLLIAPTPE